MTARNRVVREPYATWCGRTPVEIIHGLLPDSSARAESDGETRHERAFSCSIDDRLNNAVNGLRPSWKRSPGVPSHFWRAVLWTAHTPMTEKIETPQEEMPELMPDPINFTDAAVAKVKELMDEEGNPSLKLRVFVQGGGCAGFQYGFTFDEVQNPDDAVMEKGGVTLLIDSMSYQYLVGAKIDFKDDLSGAQFVIDNPNAVTTCGCGSSFGV